MRYEIRAVEIKDAKGINALRRMEGVFENILGIPSEKLKRNEDYILNLGVNDHQFVAVATDENGQEVVIGSASLNVYPQPRRNHSGSVGIMIHKDYQNMGVGTALIKTLLDIADNWLMLVRVELTVFADNDSAIHIYEKCGFVKEGLKRCAAIRSGKYEDEFIMARIHPNAFNKERSYL